MGISETAWPTSWRSGNAAPVASCLPCLAGDPDCCCTDTPAAKGCWKSCCSPRLGKTLSAQRLSVLGSPGSRAAGLHDSHLLLAASGLCHRCAAAWEMLSASCVISKGLRGWVMASFPVSGVPHTAEPLGDRSVSWTKDRSPKGSRPCRPALWGRASLPPATTVSVPVPGT